MLAHSWDLETENDHLLMPSIFGNRSPILGSIIYEVSYVYVHDFFHPVLFKKIICGPSTIFSSTL